MEKIFSLIRTQRGQRLDYTPLMDGEWWIVDFGDTDIPGVTHRIKPSPACGLLVGLRQTMWRRGKKLQTRRIPALDLGVRFTRVYVRVMDPEAFYAEHGFGTSGVDGL